MRDLLGTTLNGYQIVSLLGEGGLGQVYLARHSYLGKQIAIKSLKAEFAKSPTSIQRFFREAQIVNEIRHENIVDIFNFLYQPETDEAYIFMEYLEGKTLAEVLIQESKLPLHHVGHIGLQICSALSAAHSLGVIHRDLKPENVFLLQRAGQKNFVKIIDFGIAKLLELPTELELTKKGSIVGTPAYMSPEQVMGLSVDARSDLYALGLLLYEMSAGVLPFPSNSLHEILASRVLSEISPPSTHRDEISPLLDALIMRCLERSPERRYQSADSLAEELASACQLAIEYYR